MVGNVIPQMTRGFRFRVTLLRRGELGGRGKGCAGGDRHGVNVGEESWGVETKERVALGV